MGIHEIHPEMLRACNVIEIKFVIHSSMLHGRQVECLWVGIAGWYRNLWVLLSLLHAIQPLYKCRKPVSAYLAQNRSHLAQMLISDKVMSNPVCDFHGQDVNEQPGLEGHLVLRGLEVTSLLFVDDTVLLASPSQDLLHISPAVRCQM